jgi:hypothetical protein
MSMDLASAAEADLLIERAVSALAAAFCQRQLPRTLDILAERDGGETLNAGDAAFLADMVDRLDSASASFDQHPDIAALHRCARSLYDDIMTKAFAGTHARRAEAA